MDVWVLNSQTYLNETYGGMSGYVNVPENGITGWPTMFGITRALQIELGIGTPSNNFGIGTRAAFESQIGTISSATTDSRIVALLDCALWCKGYYGASFTSGWASVHTVSVSNIRFNMGLPSSPAAVTSKMMKSLLTMDAYTLLSGGTAAIRSGQQWLNGRYAHRLNFYLSPCDGLYTRQLQQAVMYAIQYELGMSDAVANGNLGAGTKAGLQTTGLVQLGSTDTTHRFVRLFQFALACNGYDVPQSGVFDTQTRDAVLDFQGFMEISTTGQGDYGTWAALLVSTGDPDRPVTGMDTSTPITASAAIARYNEGYRVVGRYLTVTGKAIVAGELENIFDAGLKVFPIYQNYNNAASYFTESLGRGHGIQAAIRARELGIGPTPIFFAVDYDATGAEANTIILQYFTGIAKGLASSIDVKYKVGIYATRNVCSIVSQAGKAEAIWVSGMSIGYSGNLGFPMPSDWMYNQIKEIYNPSLDRNAVSSRAQPLSTTASVPRKNGAFHPLYWGVKPTGNGVEILGLMKLQVLAEKHLTLMYLHEVDPENSPEFASRMVLYWLQQGQYQTGLQWNVYTPSFESYLGISGNHMYAALPPARNAFFTEAGANTQLDAYYEGDLQHAAATAHGVLNWGDHPLNSEVGWGDLGGWALDLVTCWADYIDHGEGTTVTQWIHSHLGAGPYSFGYDDMVADADGWLIGRELRAGATFGEAWRRVLHTTTPGGRIAAFIGHRFGTPPTARVQSCVDHLFTAPEPWTPVGYSRSAFLGDKPLPTNPQRAELGSAVAARLIVLSGS